MTTDMLYEALISALLMGVVWLAARHSVAGYRVRAENADALAKVLNEQSLRFRAKEMSDAEEMSRLNAQVEAQNQQLAEHRKSADAERERCDALARALADSRALLEAERRSLRERTAQLQQTQERLATLEGSLRQAEDGNQQLSRELGQLREDHRAVRDRLETQQSWVDEQSQLLKSQFGELATQLLNEKSATLHQSNNASIDDIISPLRQQLAEFQARVNEVHDVDTHDRAGFSRLLDGFGRAQQQLSGQAEALTRALSVTPGSAGALGNMRLELQLQAAGLEEGRHYLRQGTDQDFFGGEPPPPLAMRLPDQTGYLPVDAGLNLNAWEEVATASGEAARNAALEQHVDGLRRHIDLLGSRRYADLADGEKAIPFTLLYIPVEGAALAALDRDPELLGRAHRHKVVLATPGTLFLVVGMVAQLWRVSVQELHAQAVAQASEQLLRSLDEFVENFSRVGAALDGARRLFDDADSRLRSGDNNALAVAQRMKLLGAAPGAAQPAGGASLIASMPADHATLRLPFEAVPLDAGSGKAS